MVHQLSKRDLISIFYFLNGFGRQPGADFFIKRQYALINQLQYENTHEHFCY
ncbi:hypothetical protein DSECCO2_486410 [anaerobic digester metagenome]